MIGARAPSIEKLFISGRVVPSTEKLFVSGEGGGGGEWHPQIKKKLFLYGHGLSQ